jgi:hypothetical protein
MNYLLQKGYEQKATELIHTEIIREEVLADTTPEPQNILDEEQTIFWCLVALLFAGVLLSAAYSRYLVAVCTW